MDGFLDFACWFVQWAVYTAFSSLPLFLIVGVVTVAGRRWLSARSRFALWSLVLIRMVLPVSLETSFGLGMLTRSVTVNASSIEAADKTVELSPPDIEESANADPHPTIVAAVPAWSWTDLRREYLVGMAATFGMIGVSLILAIWFLFASLHLSYRIRHGAVPTDCRWNELLKKGCSQFGIRVPVQLRLVANWQTPATTGYFRPIIILPEDTATLSVAELQHIVWHELAHIKRGDSAWSYLWMAVRCLHWWNPCFWWTERCWLAERELACDALVMQHLGRDAGPDYGRTLLLFLERLSPSASPFQPISLPGLVMLLGDKGTIRRRLKALAHPRAMETFWGRWGSLGFVTLLAVMGLTDAASSKTENSSGKVVTVPSETVWQFSPDPTVEAEVPQLPLITLNYDISAALTRIQQDEPSANAEIELRHMIQDDRSLFPWINGKPQTDQCQIFGNALLVRATQLQHQRIQQLLSHWAEFGQQQIRFISTELELSEILPGGGGQIISPSPLGEINLLSSPQSTNEIRQLRSEPSYVRILNPDEAMKAVHRLQEHPRTSITYAPKVSMFSLSSGYISDTRRRPFVTGLRTTGDGTRETQISTANEGVQIGWTPSLVDAQRSIRLDLHIRLSQILDVETFRTKVADQSQEVCIQIPHVSEWNLKTTFTVADGKAILIAPLRRDKQGMLQLFLMTPRVIDVR